MYFVHVQQTSEGVRVQGTVEAVQLESGDNGQKRIHKSHANLHAAWLSNAAAWLSWYLVARRLVVRQ